MDTGSISIIKKCFPTTLMALAVANYKCITVGTCRKGSASDTIIFNASDLKQSIEGDYVHWAGTDAFPNDVESMPFFQH